MSTTCGINLELTKVKDDLLKGINPLEQIKNNLDQLSCEWKLKNYYIIYYISCF